MSSETLPHYLLAPARESTPDESFLVVPSVLQHDSDVVVSVVHVWLNELAIEVACLAQLEGVKHEKSFPAFLSETYMVV